MSKDVHFQAGQNEQPFPGVFPMRNHRGSFIARVIVTVTLEGKGEEGSPFREVRTYHDLDGNVLAVCDPAEEKRYQ